LAYDFGNPIFTDGFFAYGMILGVFHILILCPSLSFLPRIRVRDKLQQESILFTEVLDSRLHACALKRYGAQARE
jgi:hypothetical protein